MAIDVTYQVYTGGRWLSDVTNLNDYAGIYGSPIQGVKANLSTGSIQYRVHTTNGSWLSWVTDRTDYAGIIGQNIDGLQMQVNGLSGYTVKYRVYTGGRWLPWVTGLEDYAGIFGQAIEAIQVEIVAGGSGAVDVTYQVYTGGRWLSDVTNLNDYAGIYGSPIQGVKANLSTGSIQYRVHTTNGSWLSWVTDRTDYAGIIGQNIDGLQMQVSGLSGCTVKYRVYTGGRWLPWVTGLEDYAGIFGQAIEAIQVEIVAGGGSGGSGVVDVTYQVYTGGRWLSDVTNLNDYAGIYGSPIQGVYANLSTGSIRYKVHTINGSWLPAVTDRNDYAGILGQNIDGLQMEVINLSGYTVSYRAYVGGRWLPWVKGLEDYAGIFGQAIEAIQVEIVTGSSGGGGGDILPPVPGGRKVFIDPGHGGNDPGAIGNGMNEKDIVLEISKKVGNILTQNGVTVEYSRKDDADVKLATRAEMANNWGASLFVSIHANAYGDSSAHGTECFTYPTADSQNKQLSRNVALALSNKLGLYNRGHKEDDFAVLRLTNMPAILVETAFITNASNANLLRNRKDDFARVIATEILNYLGESTPPPVNPNNPMELIKRLTEIAIEFEKKTVVNPLKNHYNIFVLNYLRHINYSDGSWPFILGDPGPFINYVKSNYPSFANEIAPYIYNKSAILYNNIVDLPHLAATLMVYKGIGLGAPALPKHWSGWGGDLATGMADITRLKKETYPNETEESIADKYVIGNMGASISMPDIEADIDACGLVTSVFTDRIDRVLAKYFSSVTSLSRKRLLLTDIGLNDTATLNEIKDKIHEYMTGKKGFQHAFGDKLLNLATYNGSSPTVYVIEAACKSFAKYINRL